MSDNYMRVKCTQSEMVARMANHIAASNSFKDHKYYGGEWNGKKDWSENKKNDGQAKSNK